MRNLYKIITKKCDISEIKIFLQKDKKTIAISVPL